MKRVMPVRIPVYINAKFIANGKSYDGFIGNLSLDGAFVEIVPVKTVNPFLPRKRLDLKFQGNSNRTLTINCEVVWSYSKKESHGNFLNSIGIEIINPSPAYKKYFNSL